MLFLLTLVAMPLTGCVDRGADPLAVSAEPYTDRNVADRGGTPSGSVAAAIEGAYIVVVDRGANTRAIAAITGVEPKYVYDAVLEGFAATLNVGQLNALSRHPQVRLIEPDQQMSATGSMQKMDSYGDAWGLDRTDQRSSTLSRSYTYTSKGAGVYVYVFDTGIQVGHSDFEGRARNVYDVFGGNGDDCNGHGTAVAATIGGKTYGIAKRVQLRGIRVSDCKGSTSNSNLIAALDWVRKNRSNPAVANIALAGGYSSSLNTAVDNLANSGVFVAVSAGNSNLDACKVSPASASKAFTVAASTRSSNRWSSSNYGRCVDVYAPGEKIWTAKRGGGAQYWTGTSIAAPHAAGVAALYKATYGNASSSTIEGWLNSKATSSVVVGNPSNTANRLLYKSSL